MFKVGDIVEWLQWDGNSVEHTVEIGTICKIVECNGISALRPNYLHGHCATVLHLTGQYKDSITCHGEIILKSDNWLKYSTLFEKYNFNRFSILEEQE